MGPTNPITQYPYCQSVENHPREMPNGTKSVPEQLINRVKDLPVFYPPHASYPPYGRGFDHRFSYRPNSPMGPLSDSESRIEKLSREWHSSQQPRSPFTSKGEGTLGTSKDNIYMQSYLLNRQITGEYLKSIIGQKIYLFPFCREVPKSDLHVHQDGALSAQILLDFLKTNNYWLAPERFQFQQGEFLGGVSPEEWSKNDHFRDQFRVLIEMNGKRNPRLLGKESVERKILQKNGKDDYGLSAEILDSTKQFFEIFKHIEHIRLKMPTADQLYPVLRDYFWECGGFYLELMLELSTPRIPSEFISKFPKLDKLKEMDKETFFAICKKAEDDLSSWIETYVKTYSDELTTADNKIRERLKREAQLEKNQEGAWNGNFDVPLTDPKSPLHTKFIIQVMRTQNIEQFFAECLGARKLMQVDPRFVGLNWVGPEHFIAAEEAFNVHVLLCQYLYETAPEGKKPKFSLHAGELSENSDREVRRTRVRRVINEAYALRVGHATCIACDRDLDELLDNIVRKRKVFFEVCLRSNEKILSIGDPGNHPLRAFIDKGTPYGLCTDDPCVLSTDAAKELMNGIQKFDLSWEQIVLMERDCIQFSFLDGESIWEDPQEEEERYKKIKSPFSNLFKQGILKVTPEIEQIFAKSEKAQVQVKLEEKLMEFEAKYAKKATKRFSPKV
jgi:adenosine deaminase